MKKINFLEIIEDFHLRPSNMTNLPLAEEMVNELKKSEGVEHRVYCNEPAYKSILSNLLAEYDQKNIHLKIETSSLGLEHLSLTVSY